MSRRFHKAQVSSQCCTAHICGLGQHARLFVTADDDVAALALLALLVLARAVGRDAAVHLDLPTVSQEVHCTALRARGVDAAALEDAGHGVVECRCLHVHLPAFGHEGAALGVGHCGVDAAGAEFELDAATAADWDLDRLGCGQVGGAALRLNLAFVAHAGAQERHVTARGFDAALVDHCGCAAAPLKLVIARHEVGVCDAQGGRREAVGVDAAVFAKEHAIGVDQDHLAIGIELAQNLAGVGAGHAVEHDGVCARLGDVDFGVLANVKGGPVHNCFGGALVDVHDGAVGVDAGCALGHLAAGGHGRDRDSTRRTCPGQAHQCTGAREHAHIARHGSEPVTTPICSGLRTCCTRAIALSLAAGMLSYGHQGTETFGKNSFVAIGVHRALR